MITKIWQKLTPIPLGEQSGYISYRLISSNNNEIEFGFTQVEDLNLKHSTKITAQIKDAPLVNLDL